MIVVELTSGRISVAQAQGRGAQARASAMPFENLPQELAPDNADMLGEWLKGRLSEHHLSGSSSIVLLGRGMANLKAIRVPVVPDNELASVVGFAASEAIPQTGDAVIDFQPGMLIEARAGHPGDEQEVMAGSVAASHLDGLKRMLLRAGIPAKRIAIRAYATRAGWLSVAGVLPERTALVNVVDGDLEISIWSGDLLRWCRSVSLATHGNPVRLANELMRTLAAFSSETGEDRMESIALIAPAEPELVGAIEGVAGCPVLLWPNEPPPAMAAWIGGASMDAKSAAAIDFLKPKRALTTKGGSRNAVILAGVLAAVVLVGVFWLFSRQIGRRDARIASLAAEIGQLGGEIARLKSTTDRHRVVKDWLESGDPVLEELQEIAAALPDTSDFFLTGLEYNASQGGQPGTIKIDGASRDQSIITRAQTRLAGDNTHRYQVIPRGIEPGADYGPFVWRFGLDLVIEPLETADYQAQSQKRIQRLDELSKTPPQMERREMSLARTIPAGGTSGRGKAKQDKPEKEASAAAPASGGGFLEKKIDEIKKLPPAEREAAIAKEPKFFQKRLRQALEKGAP